MLEAEKNRADDIRKRKAYLEKKMGDQAEENSELQQLPNSNADG